MLKKTSLDNFSGWPLQIIYISTLPLCISYFQCCNFFISSFCIFKQYIHLRITCCSEWLYMDSLKFAARLLCMIPHGYPKDHCGCSHLDSLRIALAKNYAQVSFILQWITYLLYQKTSQQRIQVNQFRSHLIAEICFQLHYKVA